MYAALLLIPAGILTFAIMGIRHIIKTHGIFTILWRMLIGRHYSGKNHTTATFWHASNGKTHGIPSYHVSRRHHRAGGRNLLRSLGYLSGTLLASITLLEYFWACVIVLGIGATTLAGYRGYRTYGRLQEWYHSKEIVSPLAQAMMAFPDMSETDMGRAIKLVRGWHSLKTGEIGRIMLPASFHANEGEQEQIAGLIRRRMPKPVDITFKTDVVPQYALITAAPPMPTLIKWSDAVPDMISLAIHEVLLGYTATKALCKWDMASEEPMMFVSATSRRGKTTLIMLMAAQILRKGGFVSFIDPKEVGLDEFSDGQERVELYADNQDIEKLWKGIRIFRDTLDQRIKDYAKDRTLVFPRMTLFLDEVSVFNMRSQMRWNEIRPARSKTTPPVWQDIAAIIFTGAQFNVNCCIFGQRVDFATLGGLIDGFGTRLLTGHNEQTYKRLIGIMPWMKPQKPRGRFIYYNVGDNPVWMQVPYGEVQEMRTYAMEKQ